MPPVIHVEGERKPGVSDRGDLGYEYPKYEDKTLNLKPGSEMHSRIVNNVVQRAQASWDVMSRRHTAWTKIDDTLTAYIPLDEDESAMQTLDERRPVSIVIPYSYATLETLLTYLVAVFLESPYFRYVGVSSEDTLGAILLEKVVELQTLKYKAGLALHTQLRDSLVYGFGASAAVWKYRWGTKRVEGIKYTDVVFEGNKLMPIDPYLFLPDPNFPIHETQSGEFVGWLDPSSYISLLREEGGSPEHYFNAKYLEGADARSTIITTSGGRPGSKNNLPSRWNQSTRNVTSPVDIIWMYVDLVPASSEWQLGDRALPEKWIFGVAGDNVVICAQPTNLDHEMFPVAVCAPDYDGYSLSPVSRLEMMHGMQKTIDFMINSHTANVRKAINDMLIVDPYLINMQDLKTPGPGKLVRTRRAGWGRGVENAVKQLSITDVTQHHIRDVAFMIDLMQRTSAAVDSLMGIMRTSGERRSATESRDARTSAISRLSKIAKIASLMTVQDLAYLFASQTQQFMSKSVYVSTFGRLQQELEETFDIKAGTAVTPEQISVNYDVVVHDGVVDMGEHADIWVQLFQSMVSQPILMQGFDLIRVFKYIARKLGAKNIEDFAFKGGAAKIQLASQEYIRNQAAKGKLEQIPPTGRPAGPGVGLGGEEED